LSKHIASANERASLVVIEAVVLIPIVGGILGYAATFLPVPDWLQRALVIAALIIVAAPYFRMIRNLRK
jgi:uncharacterized membrane protein YdfJ with MMPL/SSD domain